MMMKQLKLTSEYKWKNHNKTIITKLQHDPQNLVKRM